jgi:hypothetical protein
MESGGLVLDVRKIVGMSDRFLLLVANDSELRQLDASILPEGEIDGLLQG